MLMNAAMPFSVLTNSWGTADNSRHPGEPTCHGQCIKALGSFNDSSPLHISMLWKRLDLCI